MNKKIISLLLSFVLLLSVACPVAFADSDTATHTHTWVDTAVSFDMEVCGLSVKINVKKCDGCGWYLHTANVVGFQFNYPSVHSLRALDGELIDALTSFVVRVLGQNATASKYETGGGSAGTGGAGRHPSGYLDDAGTPNVGSNGTLYVKADPYGFLWGMYSSGFSSSFLYDDVVLGASGSGTSVSNRYKRTVYTFVAPVTGIYYIGSTTYWNWGTFSVFSNGVWNTESPDYSLYDESTKYFRSDTFNKGETVYLLANAFGVPDNVSAVGPYRYSLVSNYVACDPLDDMQIIKNENITINNNTWNGNIYQDNSTNLTYIYPQYTTINENNETVTNISNNPIIYNNETKEYYTYDSVTNNYYYITYVTETPTPTPSPDPTPTPDPGTDPTPTPEPGGNTGDTTGILAVLVEIRDNLIQGFADLKATLVQGWADLSANFTLAIENLNLNITNIFNKKFPDQSTPETAQPSPSPSPDPSPSPTPDPDNPDATPTPTPPTTKPSGDTNNFWNFVFPGGNDDGTENGHKGILWALISLLIAVVTFVLGLGSAYSYVFPFLPAGLVTTIHICVLVLLLFAIIKFVRSFL